MKKFLNDFSKVVEGGSGALSFSVIQGLAMAASVLTLPKLNGVNYFLMFLVAVLCTCGLLLCFLSVIKIINAVAAESKIRRVLLVLLMSPVPIGVLITVTISLVSFMF